MIPEPIASRQVGGSHYQDRAIQPIDYIIANGLDFCEGSVVKYVTRWKYKNGIEDLEKAKQYVEFLIETAKRAGARPTHGQVSDEAAVVTQELFPQEPGALTFR